MAMIALLLLAAPSQAKPSPTLLAGAERFDLARPPPSRGCGGQRGSEIVVCGRRKNDDIRIDDPGRFEPRPLTAEARLPRAATLDVHAEQRSLPSGQSAPAAMVRFRIPF